MAATGWIGPTPRSEKGRTDLKGIALAIHRAELRSNRGVLTEHDKHGYRNGFGPCICAECTAFPLARPANINWRACRELAAVALVLVVAWVGIVGFVLYLLEALS